MRSVQFLESGKPKFSLNSAHLYIIAIDIHEKKLGLAESK